MSSMFNKRINQVMKLSVTDILKPLGFKKDRNHYRCTNHDLIWILEIQKSNFNSDSECSFTLNLGIYTPSVTSVYLNRAEPKTPVMTDCCLDARLGMLDSDQKDKWWYLNTHQTSNDEIIGDIQDRVHNHGLPFFQRFQTSEALEQFLSSKRSKEDKYFLPISETLCLTYAALLNLKMKRYKRCKNQMEQVMVMAQKEPGLDVMESLVKRVKAKIAMEA